MDAKQANSTPISSYLEAKGIMPEITQVHYSMYQAPFRKDNQASLKVSHKENLWIDYGEGIGGTLIDLVLKISPHLNVSEAIKDINETINTFFSFHQQETLSQNHNSYKESRFGSLNTPDPKHDFMGFRLKTENLSDDREKIISKTGATKSGTANRYNLISKTGADKKENLKNKKGSINIYKLQELGNNPIITSYLNQRCIQVATAKPYCKEIYYKVNRKRYFGLAHKNLSGWSIRNKYWKGCTAQGYSFYNNQQSTLLIFEGIFDFLSYLELKSERKLNKDILILNSLVNLTKANNIIDNYPSIKLYLDHDESGRKATQYIRQQFPEAEDQSSFYSPCKDLNDYHLKKNMGKMVNKEEQLTKENR